MRSRTKYWYRKLVSTATSHNSLHGVQRGVHNDSVLLSAVYNANNNGPYAEFCETPHTQLKTCYHMRIDDRRPRVLSVTKEVSTVPLSLYDALRRRSKISKSTVWIAALMSVRPSSLVSCDSTMSILSDSTLRMSVFVECPA